MNYDEILEDLKLDIEDALVMRANEDGGLKACAWGLYAIAIALAKMSDAINKPPVIIEP